LSIWTGRLPLNIMLLARSFKMDIRLQIPQCVSNLRLDS
jgi:hypothetical protein